MANSPLLPKALDKRCFGRRGCVHAEGAERTIIASARSLVQADKHMRENEVCVNHVMRDGSDEIDLFAREQKVKTKLAKPLLPRTTSSPTADVLLARKNDADLLAVVNRYERYADDITGQPLDPELCRLMQNNKLRYFRSGEVRAMRRVQEAWFKT